MKTEQRNCKADALASLKQSLKSILRGYTTVTPQMLTALEQLGFQVSRKRNHYILIIHTAFYSNQSPDRILVFVLAKTPSDNRAGLNFASIICSRIKASL